MGDPAVSERRWQVPLADVAVGDELTEAVLGVVRSGWWSMGPRVEEFEDAGVDLLLLQCSPQLEEMERFAAEVISRRGAQSAGA